MNFLEYLYKNVMDRSRCCSTLLPVVTTAVKSVSQPEIEIGQILEHCSDFDTNCHEVVVKLVQGEDTYI